MILWTEVHQAPLSVGFFRKEYWSGLPCLSPGDLPDLGTELVSLTSPALTGGLFTKAMALAIAHSSTFAWKIPWTEEPGGLQSMGSLSQTRLSDFTFTFHFHALEKEMATHPSVLAWRIPGTGEPDGLPSLGSHRVRHD